MSKVRKGIVLLVTAATMTIVPAAMRASGASDAAKVPVKRPAVTTPVDAPHLMGSTWQ